MMHNCEMCEGWSLIFTNQSTKRMLNYTRFLLNNKDNFIEVIEDFIKDVNVIEPNYTCQYYLPPIYGIRGGVGVDKFYSDYMNEGKSKEDYYEECEYLCSIKGISCEEGIELFNNLIQLGMYKNINYLNKS
jgi:hypothetical protein